MAPMSMSRFGIHLTLLASLGLTLSSACFASSQGTAPASTTHRDEPASQAEPKPKERMSPPSLGELARQQRAHEADRKPAVVYTNDNLPAGGSLTVLGSPRSGNAQEASAQADQQGKPGEHYYRARELELQNHLDVHQRELEVLQQELGENQVQYYSNPSQAMQQQYSREDINDLRAAIDRKQQQVDGDRQAISDLDNELRREGGDQQWLESKPTPATAPTAQLDLSGIQKGSEEYWRRRFSAARDALAWAREQRQLAEDELRLLQSQQAHDLGTPAAEAAESKIADKQSDVESKRAAEAQAQQELDSLENEFRQSGVPEEWSKPNSAEPAMPGSPQNSNR
jgi:hypothetical protein